MQKLINTYPDFDFEQSSHNSPQFLAFAKLFKTELKKQLESIGAKIDKVTVGHFYISGFFTKGGKFYYLSWHNGDKQLMYRTAKNNKDYSGGSNQWVRISEDLASQMVLH